MASTALTAGGFREEMQQALEAALQLLADVEAQIRGALGLAASASIYDAAPEQLHSLPPAVLETLESTLQVVQELRQQQQASIVRLHVAHAAAEPSDSAATAVVRGVQDGHPGTGNHDIAASPLSSAATAGAQHSRVSSPASRNQRSPASGSNKRLSLQQHTSAKHLHDSKGSASKEGSTGTPLATTKAAAAAARSSLFTPDASRQARAEWLAGKLQQQQDAASALERDLQREQQLLQKLADKKLAAEVTHAQAMRDVRQLTGALQVLSTADEQWAAYLEAAKQELQAAHDAT